MVNWNKIVGGYVIIMSIISIIDGIYAIYSVRHGEGLTGLVVFPALILIAISIFLIFLSIFIIKEKGWAKITSLVIFSFLTLMYLLAIPGFLQDIFNKETDKLISFLGIIFLILYIIGIIFISLSLKKKK